MALERTNYCGRCTIRQLGVAHDLTAEQALADSLPRPEYVGVGIYSPAQAARLTRVPSQSLHRWLRGYSYTYQGHRRSSPPLIERQLPVLEGTVALGFLDLMEVRFISAFRQHGVSLQAIRLAAERAREILEASHPFSRHSFKTDGRSIFGEIARQEEDPVLLDLVRNQYAFREVLSPYLYEGIEFEAEDPVRWRPLPGNRRVVLDPVRQFGQPIVDPEGVPTEILAGPVRTAEEPIERVARWFEVPKEAVRAAVEFEEYLAARAA